MVFFSWHQFRHTGPGKVPDRNSRRLSAAWNYSLNSAEWEATTVPLLVIVHE